MTEYLLPTDPCPAYLTADEAVVYLRLDKMPELTCPKRVLERWRIQGMLGGCRVTREFVYPRTELDAFMADLLEGPRGT